MEKNLIFSNKLEDFSKMFLATFLVFVLFYFTNAITSTAFLLLTIYFLDGGHVYSTLLEVLADPEEVRKKYVWGVLLGSFFFNLMVHYFFNAYFFYYIFYFTIYHNMRQGLGVTFLYRMGEKRSLQFIKYSYYFLTVVPFILFHAKPPMAEGTLGEAIIKPIDFYQYFSAESLDWTFRAGVTIYILGAILISVFLFWQKNLRGFFSMIFFAAVYGYAFLISNNEMTSYALLIFSHAIPYYFLMEKRLAVTHKINIMQRYAWVFLILIFALGGAIDYFQGDIIGYFEPWDSLAMAMLTTPLIAHFIYDAIIWKRGNERFKAFLEA